MFERLLAKFPPQKPQRIFISADDLDEIKGTLMSQGYQVYQLARQDEHGKNIMLSIWRVSDRNGHFIQDIHVAPPGSVPSGKIIVAEDKALRPQMPEFKAEYQYNPQISPMWSQSFYQRAFKPTNDAWHKMLFADMLHREIEHQLDELEKAVRDEVETIEYTWKDVDEDCGHLPKI